MYHQLALLLVVIYVMTGPVFGDKPCKGFCKRGKCGKNNCIQKAVCVWNSDSCEGKPTCRQRCRSKVCPACKLPTICDDNFIDVAVVGGGVSGLYSALKLSQHYDWSIQVFEANYRVGGRTFSVPMPGITDFKADFGAMRYKPKSHTRLVTLAQELKLTKQPFTTPSDDETLYFFREELLDKTDIANGKVPYKMTEKEREISGNMDALQAYWNNLIIANDSQDLKDPWNKICVDGKMAYEKGNYNAWLEVTSKDAIDYFTFMSIFTTQVFSNTNYASWSATEYTANSGPPEQLYTFKEGFQELSVRMARKFLQQERTQLFINHELQSVRHEGDLAVLHFTNTVTRQSVNLCAREVILGLSAESLKRIDFLDKDLSITLNALLPAVIQEPSTKTYLVYDSPWWRHLGKGPTFRKLRKRGIELKYILTDLPVGQVLEIGVDKTTGNAMLVIYNDWWDRLQFWAPYMINGTEHVSGIPSEFVATQRLIRQINLQLAKLFNLLQDEVPMPIASVAHAWYDKPYLTGWHFSSPGFHYPTVQRDILKPVSNKGVYIVGEAFSSFHGWTEGALETSQAVLTKHFDIAF